MLRQLTLFFTLTWCASAQATLEQGHIWTQISKVWDTENWEYTVQFQHRYNLDRERLFEEQLNLSAHNITSWGEWGVIYTFGTINGYEKKAECRWAVEATVDIFKGKSFLYDMRFRYERRDLARFENKAHRFRLRQELWWFGQTLLAGEPEISSELNYYLTSIAGLPSGFSSHRTIMALNYPSGTVRWNVGYLNDYRENPGGIEVRHVLQLGMHFN